MGATRETKIDGDRMKEERERKRQIGCRNHNKEVKERKKDAGIEKLEKRKFISVCA